MQVHSPQGRFVVHLAAKDSDIGVLQSTDDCFIDEPVLLQKILILGYFNQRMTVLLMSLFNAWPKMHGEFVLSLTRLLTDVSDPHFQL
jgi:hypothetical protein